MKEPTAIKLTQEQYNVLSSRLEKNELTAEDRVILGQVLRAMIWLSQQLEAGRLHIARLKRLIFGEKSEKKTTILGGRNGNTSGKKLIENSSSGDKYKKGHGRRSASDYPGAKKVFCQHDSLKAGDPCPDCGRGYLHHSIKNGKFICFTGHPPITATYYETEKLRCGACGKAFEASLPDGVIRCRWDESAKTTASLLRYGYGFPHYTLEKLQTELGIPISDSKLFDLANEVADCGYAPYKYLLKLAAQGVKINADDTNCRILDLIQENKKTERERTGIFTTAMISLVDNHEIALFFSGRNHCGENLGGLLKERPKGMDPPLLMADASSRNVPKEYEVILHNCLTHGRRQFVDLVESFPQEIEYVIMTLGKVYHNDAITKEKGLSDDERLLYHQEHSKPIMDELKSWYDDQLDSKKVEPNSSLGKAIKYMQKRWDKLTLFLAVPGADLSNDIVERLIKTCIRHRKNSLFFWTQHGAVVGDILMTLIQTSVKAKINPFHYLTELQRHRSEAHKNPKHWLPWTYNANLSPTTH